METFFILVQKGLWGPPLLLFLVATGAYLGWILLSRVEKGVFQPLQLRRNQKKTGEIHPFASVMTSLAGAIGTGSIVGVATAVTFGGLGAIFWMWVTAIFLLPIKFSESLLSLHYRQTDEKGSVDSGPMLYMVKGLGWKRAATLFAFLGVLGSLFGTGNWIQIHSIADVAHHVWQIPPLWVGIALSVVTLAIVLGGIRAIGRVAAVLVPTMSLLYLVGAIAVLTLFRHNLSGAFQSLFEAAWSPRALFVGAAGATLLEVIQIGVARSILCSEAGLGISSISTGAAKTASPIRQAGWVTLGSVLCPLVVCTMTGLAIAVVSQGNASLAAFQGAALVTEAFGQAMAGGEWIVSVGLILFAYSTILAWAYAGEKCIEFLWGERAILPYRCFFAFWLIPGSLLSIHSVWPLADITNGLMMIPNLFALVFLGKKVAEILENRSAAAAAN